MYEYHFLGGNWTFNHATLLFRIVFHEFHHFQFIIHNNRKNNKNLDAINLILFDLIPLFPSAS
jgi:hypothetical protein